MLDTGVTLFSFNMSNDKQTSNYNKLVFKSCRAIVYDSTYSEFDELSFASLNDNCGFGYIEYEFGFSCNLPNPYMDFFVSCFSFRTDTLEYPAIKINGMHTRNLPKFMREHNYTKVDKNGNMSMGVRLFFRNKHEREAILNCNEICIEGFIAFGKKTNTYGVMTRLLQDNNEWIVVDANTYRPYKHNHVYSNVH